MLDRSAAARIAGIASWEQSRERKLVASARGGNSVVERYGRSHMLRLALRRRQYGCRGGGRLVPVARINEAGRGPCPACGKETRVGASGVPFLHVAAGAPPALRRVK